jgi:hypothetical protein
VQKVTATDEKAVTGSGAGESDPSPSLACGPQRKVGPSLCRSASNAASKGEAEHVPTQAGKNPQLNRKRTAIPGCIPTIALGNMRTPAHEAWPLPDFNRPLGAQECGGGFKRSCVVGMLSCLRSGFDMTVRTDGVEAEKRHGTTPLAKQGKGAVDPNHRRPAVFRCQ